MLNKDYYYCFSCGAHGDVINLVQQHFGLSLIDAAKKIITDFNLNIPRYVDTYEDTVIDPQDIYKRREEVSLELKKVTKEIEDLCKELGIKNPLLNDIFDN